MEQSTTRSPKYIAILAAASSVILIVGWLARPSEIAQGPPTLPSENELAQLARRAERRSLEDMAAYFATTADEIEGSIVDLPELATSGVVWNPGLIVTAPLPPMAGGPVTVVWSRGTDSTQPAMFGPRLPLAAMATGRAFPGLNAAPQAASLPAPGSWVLGVWRADQERRFAAGTYLQSAPVTCGSTRVVEIVSSLALHGAMAGGGLFDIDGGLLGIILPCGGRLAAIATSSVASILERADTVEQRLLARYGLVVAALNEDEMAFFKVKGGVVVREVWTGYRADQASLMPGDIIGELDGAQVAEAADLRAMTNAPGERSFALTVQRGAKTVTVTIPHKSEGSWPVSAAEPGVGLNVESPPKGYSIDSVVPGSRAAAAGIEPGDRLIRIDHAEPQNVAQVRRVLARDQATPVLLDIERDGRRLAILVR